MSLRDLILASNDIRKEPVTVPEWTGPDGKPLTVYVKTMNTAERLAWAQGAFDDAGEPVEQFRERLIVHTAVDESGALVFTDDDIPALAGKSGGAVLRLSLKAEAVNSLRVRDVDDAEKN